MTIQNISDSIVYIGRTFSLFFISLEAKNKNGQWVKIDKPLNKEALCLTGHPTINLKPQELIVSKIRRYKGSYETDFRLAFGYEDNLVYSNTFRDFMDERTLQDNFTNE